MINIRKIIIIKYRISYLKTLIMNLETISPGVLDKVLRICGLFGVQMLWVDMILIVASPPFEAT